jgi:hypothetical protein
MVAMTVSGYQNLQTGKILDFTPKMIKIAVRKLSGFDISNPVYKTEIQVCLISKV